MTTDANLSFSIRHIRSGILRNNTFKKILAYSLLTIGALIMLYPFMWMISTSLKTTSDAYTASFFPKNPTLSAYLDAWSGARIQSNFPRWYLNSFVVTGVSILSTLLFCSLGGYAFSRYRFPGRNLLFLLVLSTMMIPTEMLIIPWFQIMVDLKWTNSFQGLMWPHLITGFGIFLMKQFIDGVPEELLDAARVDGMSEFGIFYKIVLPLVKPAIGALAIFTFLGVWNDFLWPVIVTDKIAMWTVALGIGSYQAQGLTLWNLQMAAATIASIPIIIIFIFFQRQIVEGISLTGIKG
jgi:multiple sugar transport system permease protein